MDVAEWGLVQSVISAWWSFDEHGHESTLDMARCFARWLEAQSDTGSIV